MARIDWGQVPRDYTSGLDRGVYYNNRTGTGVPWVGLTSVKATLSESNNKAYHQDGIRYRNRRRPGDISGTIEAFTTPSTFYDDPLTQYKRSEFSLCYRVKKAAGYELHILYNIMVKPSSYTYKYDDVDTLSWAFETRPHYIPGASPSAHLILSSENMPSHMLTKLENILYGSDTADGRLMIPLELIQMVEESTTLQIIDHGDGTWSAIGPDEMIFVDEETRSFEIESPTANYISEDTYTISSL